MGHKGRPWKVHEEFIVCTAVCTSRDEAMSSNKKKSSP